MSPRRWLIAGLSLLVTATPSGAQDPRLAARLDPSTYAAVTGIVDSARVARLPTEPLVDKALEGARKGADGARIVAAVRTLASELGMARRALGRDAKPDEIKAGANAIHAGFPASDLARLRAAAPKRRLTMALAVVTDLIARDVPVPAAADIVVSLARSGVRDADLALFQRNVRVDIENGADPSTAASTRARGVLMEGKGAGDRSRRS